jgi:putative transposase
MPNYRCAFLAPGCWFFTVNLLYRRQTLLVDHIDALRSAFAATRKNYPFDIAAIVVVPDHLHAVCTWPLSDAGFSTRWRLIKTRYAKALSGLGTRSAMRAARGTRHLAALVLGAPATTPIN